MPGNNKETIYVDIDDEITSIIDKVRSAQASIIALVLPKRATMLQSSVNMKLLKKAADSSKRRVVLITTEAGLLPLASSVGLYVAKTLQSKPEIPTSEALANNDEIENIVSSDDKSSTDDELDAAAAATTPVGELAGTAAAADALTESKTAKAELTPRPIPRAKAGGPDDEIELDNTDKGDTKEAAAGAAAEGKKKGDKKIKVPNFERFRLRIILAGALLIILIVGFIIANIVLPKATVTISTNTSNVNSSLTLNLNPTAKTLDTTQLIVPATVQQLPKSASQQVSTTGQKNNGTAASGTVTMVAQECGSFSGFPDDVPAGTGITSNSLTYITTEDTSFSHHGTLSNSCVNFQASSSTSIKAQGGGASYNVQGASFSVVSRPDVSATGSASGGTDNIVQVVTQTDIDNATQKLAAPATGSIKSTLQNSLTQAGLYAIPATFNASSPATTQSANVGDQANTVTVTETITYSMLGVHQSDLQTLIDNNVDQQINTSKQSILDDGLAKASFSVLNNSGTGGAQVTSQDTATISPKLDVASIKSQIAGKKTGDVESIINNDPGVTKVTVHYSPFWVSAVPSHTSKIIIQIKKSS